MSNVTASSVPIFRFGGYASLFQKTDLGGDQVKQGAFIKSLKHRPLSHIPMLYQHQQEEPIGRWVSIEERSLGLYVKGELNLRVQRAQELKALMLQGAVSGLSIGFKAIAATSATRPRQGNKVHERNPLSVRRFLNEIDLFEISIVPMPMLPEARIDWFDTEISDQPTSLPMKNASLLTLIQTMKHMLQEGAKA